MKLQSLHSVFNVHVAQYPNTFRFDFVLLVYKPALYSEVHADFSSSSKHGTLDF